jgi:hypothetical protein
MNAGKRILAALAITGVFASGAYAQTDTMPVQKPFSVKLGAAFFTDSDTKDRVGNSTFSVGLGYDITKTNATMPIILQAYVDYFAPKSKERTISAVTQEIKMESAFGVGVAGRYAFIKEPKANLVPYAGAGLGFYSVKRKVEVTGSPTNSKTKSGLGGKVFGGVELKEGFFGEVDFNFLPKVEEDNFSNFGLRIGYRF